MKRISHKATLILKDLLVLIGIIAIQEIGIPFSAAQTAVPSAVPGRKGQAPVGVASAGNGSDANLIPNMLGTLLGPYGLPPASAMVTAIYSDHSVSGILATDGQFYLPIGHLVIDGRGPAKVAPDKLVKVVATSQEFGFGWIDVQAGAVQNFPAIKLVKDQPIRGRILDAGGRPVVGATVHVEEVWAYPFDDLKTVLLALKSKDKKRTVPFIWVTEPEWSGPVPGQTVGEDTVTGRDGRFHLTGLGRGRAVRLQIKAKEGQPVGITVLTFPRAASNPLLPEKDSTMRPLYLADFDHRLTSEKR